MPENKKPDPTLTGMGQRIDQAQAAALAEGFLDNIGSSKDDLRPRKTLTEAILLVGELILSCQENLNKANRNSSGKLSASLIAGEPTLKGKAMVVDMLMNFYGRFVNKGVKGTRSGSSTAGYSFKNENVSKKMAAALAAWIERGKVSTSSVQKYKGYGAHETKQKRISQIDSAYAISRAIKRKGLKPTGFLDMAVKETTEKVQERLGIALKIDIINSLTGI